MSITAGSTNVDPSHDLSVRPHNPLDYIFCPKKVALIGATDKEGSVGRTLLWNLISNPFGGSVYPINPKRSQVLGVPAYPTIKDVPGPVDLAVICTAAKMVPGLVKECVAADVKGLIIISAGFKEMGKEGEEYERQIKEATKGTRIRVVGPNCLGVMNPLSGLNATFGSGMAHSGSVAFISQSGALCTAILDWSIGEQVGFSSFVSIGSMIDVNWGDLIDYFGNDPRTSSIVIYMESVGDAQAFLSAAREVALSKPIIVIKAGRTAEAAKAAASHTGSLTGSDDVLDAAFKRAGVMRVDHISDLFFMADVLSKQPLPKGKKLSIVTNAGGPGVLATDALVQGGGALTSISKETFDALNAILPASWSRNNPIDVLGDATPELYAKALEITSKDADADGMLVILTPQDMTDPTKTAEALKPYARTLGKPVLASWMGGPLVQAGREILHRAGIPVFNHPDNGCQAFNYLWRYSANLEALYETPVASDNPEEYLAARKRVAEIVASVRKDNRTLLNEYESKKLLEAYGIPTVKTEIAATTEAAVAEAEKMGFPVVLKLYSNTITHKTDVGGVKLNLQNGPEVAAAFNAIKQSVTEKVGAEHFQGVTVQEMIKVDGYELILGSSADPQFGPVLLFGAGGQLVEVFKDRALGLPPLTGTLARRMMETTKISKALKGVRGRKPCDVAALEQLVVRFSHLVSQETIVKELDINPLVISSEKLIALDARVVLHDASQSEDKLPKPAIRPYPVQHISTAKMKDGSEFSIRPIRAEDQDQIVEFHQKLSEQTVLNRYHQNLMFNERVAHGRMVRICFTDYARELSLIATTKSKPKKDQAAASEIIAVVRLYRHRENPKHAEFALVVADAWHRKGIGSQLLKSAIVAAKSEGVTALYANVLKTNSLGMLLCESLGFKPEGSGVETKVRFRLEL